MKRLLKDERNGNVFLAVLGVAIVFVLALTSCSSKPGSPASGPNSSSVPSATATPAPAATPRNAWTVSSPQINAMDGVRSQYVSTGDAIRVVLCFKNGKPCGGDLTSVDLRVPCWIDSDEPGSYHRKIRIRFDDEKPRVERWGITDNHKGLFPPSPPAFVAELKRHKTLLVELGCDSSDPGTVVTIDIQGLQESLDQLKEEKAGAGT
jgi:hypothetical protein